MDTELVTLQLPANLYEKLQALAIEKQIDAIGEMVLYASKIQRAVNRSGWKFSRIVPEMLVLMG